MLKGHIFHERNATIAKVRFRIGENKYCKCCRINFVQRCRCALGARFLQLVTWHETTVPTRSNLGRFANVFRLGFLLRLLWVQFCSLWLQVLKARKGYGGLCKPKVARLKDYSPKVMIFGTHHRRLQIRNSLSLRTWNQLNLKELLKGTYRWLSNRHLILSFCCYCFF